METNQRFIDGGGSRISKWRSTGDIYRDMSVPKALTILGLRDKEYREGDVNVLKAAFAKKLANPSQIVTINPRKVYNFRHKEDPNNQMVIHEAYQYLLKRKGCKSTTELSESTFNERQTFNASNNEPLLSHEMEEKIRLKLLKRVDLKASVFSVNQLQIQKVCQDLHVPHVIIEPCTPETSGDEK